ncbi:MAG: RNA polymerase sigma-70 factor [Bacteroidota bacterium]
MGDHGQPNRILFTRIKEGDFLSFNSLYKRYYQGLCLFASRITGNHDAAEDVVQEVFLNIWGKRDRININGSVKSYLFNAVRNRSFNHVRREKLKLGIISGMAGDRNRMAVEQNLVETEELRLILVQCIDRLPPRCGEIFGLSRFEGKRLKEIAEQLDISVNTVKVQIGKALSIIRTCLGEKYDLTDD